MEGEEHEAAGLLVLEGGVPSFRKEVLLLLRCSLAAGPAAGASSPNIRARASLYSCSRCASVFVDGALLLDAPDWDPGPCEDVALLGRLRMVIWGCGGCWMDP